MIINDKAEGLMADGCKKITVFLAPKVLLVQQVFNSRLLNIMLAILAVDVLW